MYVQALRRNLLNVEGAHRNNRAWSVHEIFDHAHIPFNHANFYINKAVGQADKDFLAVEQAVSPSEHAL